MCRQAAGRRAWHLGVTCGGCGALCKEAEELTSGGGPPGGGRGFKHEDVELEHHPGDVPLTQQLPRASQHLHLVPLHVSLQHPHGRDSVINFCHKEVSFLPPLRPGRDCLNTGVTSDFCVSLNTASVLALSTDPTMLYSAA